MKVRDYKTLLEADRKTAMLFDLTERFPRGPEARLRDHDYKDHDGEVLSHGWGSNTAPYLNTGVATAENSPMTGGWNPYDIYELPDNEWTLESHLAGLHVPVEASMNKHDTWQAPEGHAKLFKRGAQLTRRSRRLANRIRQAKKWVKENIGTAVYSIQFGWRGRDNIFVHADNEEGAKKQFELFMGGAFNSHCPDYEEGSIQVEYVRPAKTPLELMSLNQPFINSYVDSIKKKKETAARLLAEAEAMDMAHQVVNIYAINMVASWGTGEGEGDNA